MTAARRLIGISVATATPGKPNGSLQRTRSNASRRELTNVIREEIDEREGRPDTGAGVEDREARPLEEPAMPSQRVVLIVIRVSVIRLEKRSRSKRQSAATTDAEHLGDGRVGKLEMLEHRLAVHAGDGSVSERQLVRVPRDVHAAGQDDVEVRQAWMHACRTTADG
jgi:hypothetical protein